MVEDEVDEVAVDAAGRDREALLRLPVHLGLPELFGNANKCPDNARRQLINVPEFSWKLDITPVRA